MSVTDDDQSDAESIPLSDLRADLEDGDGNEGQHASGDRDEMAARDDATSPSDDETEEADSVPLSGLRDEVDRRARDDPERDAAVAEEAFTEETVDQVDSEGVWADLLMGEENPEGHFEAAETEAGADGPTQVISKRICERCRYLEAPPELTCTHDGTTIHELVDMDHVRVSSCPMVGPDGQKTKPTNAEDR